MTKRERTYPRFRIYRDTRNEWRWTYFASNGLTIAVSSESYVNKVDAIVGVELMRSSISSPIYEATTAGDQELVSGKPPFVETNDTETPAED